MCLWDMFTVNDITTASVWANLSIPPLLLTTPCMQEERTIGMTVNHTVHVLEIV